MRVDAELARWLAFLAEEAEPEASSRHLTPWVAALVYGLLSALSLPLGALLGIVLSPVNPYVVACIIAFGAGCLLFAVTVELYGHQLARVKADHDHMLEINVCIVAAIFGAVGYIMLNRWVESWEQYGEEPPHPPAHKPNPHPSKHRLPLEHAKTAGEVLERGQSGVSSPDDHETPRTPRSAHKRWRHIRIAVHLGHGFKCDVQLRHGTHGSDGVGSAHTLALGMLAGIVADGVPEAVLIGFLAVDGHLSLMFIVSLFIANFPESFSSASLMQEHKVFPWYKSLGMWTFPFVLTGLVAGFACWLIPKEAQDTVVVRILAALIEGLAGGMMLAMISSVMLPQAFTMAKEHPVWTPWKRDRHRKVEPDEHHGGDVPGVLCVCGFLFAVWLKVLGGAIEGSTH